MRVCVCIYVCVLRIGVFVYACVHVFAIMYVCMHVCCVWVGCGCVCLRVGVRACSCGDEAMRMHSNELMSSSRVGTIKWEGTLHIGQLRVHGEFLWEVQCVFTASSAGR